MTIYRWRDQRDVIARLVNERDIKGFFKRDVILNPGEAAMIIVQGKITDAVTQTELKKIGGGFINWIKRLTDMESGTQLLFMVTTPIELEIPISTTSKDYQTMKGTTTIRLQLTTTSAPKIINLIKRDEVLTSSGLEYKIQSELIAMVFSNVISKHTVEEFHGNIDIQKEMETTATVELRKTLGLWGLDLIKMFTVWKEGAYDELMKYKGDLAIHDGKQDAYNQSMIRLVQREHDYNMEISESQWDLALGDLKGEERIKTERLLSEIERDKAGFDEEVRQEREKIELEKEKMKSVLETDRERVDLELDRDKREMDMAMAAFERVQAAKRERMKLGHDFKAKQMEVQTESTERLMSKAIDTGVADSESLQEMMRQQTMQKMADRGAEKVQALAEAEGKRYEKDSYRDAEDRERDYEKERMGLSAEQMKAAKQNVPTTLIKGASSTPTVTHVGADKGSESSCPHCGAPVQEGWKACPSCGDKL